MAKLPVNNIAQNFPSVSAPFVDSNGLLTDSAQSLLQALWQRTGSEVGIDGSAVAGQVNGALVASNALSELDVGTRQARARVNLGLSGGATAQAQRGWSTPSGAVSRTAINSGWSGSASAAYTQSEAQATVTQVQALSKATGALIEDLVSYGVLSYGS